MVVDFSQVKEVTIPEGNVKQINSGSDVLWKLKSGATGFVGVQIDESNSSPDGAVTYPQYLTTYDASGVAVGIYTNLAYGATAMSGASSTFNPGTWVSNSSLYNFIKDIKPVSFDGTTWTDLNKTSESSWPTDRDCFTEFPFRWLSISKSGNYISVVFYGGDTAPDATFCDDAFLKSDASAHNKEFHLGCYTASGSYSSGVYSKKGASNLVSVALNRYWVGAAARNGSTAGTNYGPYDCMPYAMWTYLQALFLVLYKSRNCQTAHSQGYVGGSSVQSNTGFSAYGNELGQYGSSSTTQQNAFFWLHNLWGNMYQFSASLFTRAGSSRELYYMKEAMSKASNWDSGWNSTSAYAKMSSKGTDTGKNCSSASSPNYIKVACGNNTAGFAPFNTSGGSASTYWPDYGYVSVYSSRAYFPYLGGYYDDEDSAGLFRCGVDSASARSNTGYGSRLAYRGGRT